MHTDHTADHLGHDDHVTKMRLHYGGLASVSTLLLRLSQALNQVHGNVATSESSPCARMQQVHQLSMSKIQQLVDFQASVEEATEGLSLLNLGLLCLRIVVRL